MTNLIAKHGGFRNLKSFQSAQISYDFTFHFCQKFVPAHKMRDQLEGAARSGVQNIAEGSSTSGTSKQSEIRLVTVARASLDELLLDFEDFLRQRGLNKWDKNDERVLKIRQLAYTENRTYKTYETYMTNAEAAANCAICIINQANFLLDRQLKTLEQDLAKNGDFKERIKEQQKDQIFNSNDDFDDFLNSFNLKRLPNGQVVTKDEQDK